MITSTPSRRALTVGWTATSTRGQRVPADVSGVLIPVEVPGSIHTDLLAAGLIPDPFTDDSEHIVSWIGSTDWRYHTTFDWTPSDATHTDLVFYGLDTVAKVTLNGTIVLEARNQHRTYRIPVSSLLSEGANELIVDFEAPVTYADRASLELGYRPHVNHHPYNAIRKMASNYGWDWGIDAATVGIWRVVELESWSKARIAAARPSTSVSGGSGTLEVVVDVESDQSAPLTLRVTIDGAAVTVPVTSAVATATVQLPEVRRWWPNGYGEQALYDVLVELLDGENLIDTWAKRVGFRSIELDVAPDAAGTPMTFVVNGQPMFVRGANWIPDDAFVHRVTRERYFSRVSQARDANINLLRVWGGGIFESDDFYDACDELGILTWQDFLLACAAYSEDEPMHSEMEAEARDNITRIMPHASLALWNGGNENVQGFQEWGWEARLQGKSWGAGYHDGLFPRLVAELDPQRVYTPASPWSPGHPELPANDPEHGSFHNWELWNRADYPHYRDTRPRFVAEFGWQGPPTWSTLTSSISDDPLTPESPGMLVHQKAQDGNDKLTDGLVAHLPYPNDIDDWHWSMSLNQATAVGVAIDYLRSLSPHCMGSVVWQLNDCWPVTSWAAIDGNGRLKPLWYSMKHSYSDRLITVQPGVDGLAVAVVNDSGEPWTGELAIERLDFDGTVLASHSVAYAADGRTTTSVPIPASVSSPRNVERELVVARVGEQRGLWFFSEYRDSGLDEGRLTASVTTISGGYVVSVVAESLIRDLVVLADKIDPDAVVDDMLVTLLPGDRVEFTVRSAVAFDPERLLDRSVLRSANQLVVPASRTAVTA